MVLRVSKDVGEIELLKGLCGQQTNMGSKLWKRAGKTRRIDKAMGGASVHGCRFMPALVLECRNQPLPVSRRLTLSKLGISPAIPERISDQHCLVSIT